MFIYNQLGGPFNLGFTTDYLIDILNKIEEYYSHQQVSFLAMNEMVQDSGIPDRFNIRVTIFNGDLGREALIFQNGRIYSIPEYRAEYLEVTK